MQIFNEQKQNKRNGTSNRTCSYCGSFEHVVTGCDKAENDWGYFSKFQIPLIDPNNWVHSLQTRLNYQGNPVTYTHWFKEPSQWGTWYVQCEKAVGKIQAARLREQQKANAKSKGRKATKCGFCGGEGHNRRDCSEMSSIQERLLAANRHWRQRFYDKLVRDMGISLGSVVKIEISQGWNKPTNQEVAIVKSINFDELSMFCWADSASDWKERVDYSKFGQQLKITVTANGKDYSLLLGDSNRGHFLKDSFGGLSDISQRYGQVGRFVSLIARSETPLDQEWIEQAHEESVLFLTKKYSMERLKHFNLLRLLEKHEENNKKYLTSIQ